MAAIIDGCQRHGEEPVPGIRGALGTIPERRRQKARSDPVERTNPKVLILLVVELLECGAGVIYLVQQAQKRQGTP